MITRLFLLTLIATINVTGLSAADKRFVGKWTLDPEQSTVHDQMKVSRAGGDRFIFDFGSSPESIAVDGTDQPGIFGTTLAVTQEASNLWKVVRKKDGRMMISAIWTLSPIDKSLRDDFTGFNTDGTSYTIHYIYTPIGESDGFAAIWDSTSEKLGPADMDVSAYQRRGLTFINQTEHSTKNMIFDGKEHPVADTSGHAGATTLARQLDARTLEFLEMTNGKLVDTERIQVSADSNILTMTIQPANRQSPNTIIFKRNAHAHQ